MADDHKIVRQGLRFLIEKQPDMKVIAEAADGRTTVQMIEKLLPDVVIMDIAMPYMNGIEAARQIIAKNPGTKVIILSMHSDRRFVTEVLKAGVSGYLLKDCAFEELVEAIHAVIANRTFLGPEIIDVLIKDFVYFSSSKDGAVFSVLTIREREVLQLISEGKTTKQIATSLNVSTKTVETYRQQIMDKLDVHSIAGLTKYALREGLTSLEG